MSIKYKFECHDCRLDVFFEVKINPQKFVCPECRQRTLRIGAYRRDGNLAVFQLIEEIEALKDRFRKLEALFPDSELDKYLVS